VNPFPLLVEIIISPSKAFQDICKNGESYKKTIYFCFIVSSLIPLWKSFSKERAYFNFFANETANAIISFYSIPQVQWLTTFVGFVLFIFTIAFLCRFFTNGNSKTELIHCVVSTSLIGILLQFIFILFQVVSFYKKIPMLWWISIIWIVVLTIIAIKNSQQITYLRATLIFLCASIPIILVIGVTGLAPFLLWLT